MKTPKSNPKEPKPAGFGNLNAANGPQTAKRFTLNFSEIFIYAA
jgi:hypothetical protein